MVAVHAGEWLVADQTREHAEGGARVRYVVSPVGVPPAPARSGKVRTYYIAADEVEWNYAPFERNMCEDREFSEGERVFMERGHGGIGATYVKAIYREYTDGAFDKLKYGALSRNNEASRHLGLLGPVLRGEVGDEIRVVFRNRLRGDGGFSPIAGPLRAAMAPLNELQRAAAGAGHTIVPGGEAEIRILLTEGAGPAQNDASTAAWAYSTGSGDPADVDAGLVGVILVTRKGEARGDGSPTDVAREFVMLYNTFDEGKSRYKSLNVLKYMEPQEAARVNFADPHFKESNKMHAINGYSYCNQPNLRVREGQSVRFYSLALGGTHGMHTPRIHGHSFLEGGRRVNTAELLPGQGKVLDMVSESHGTWLVHCDVHDHQSAGMNALLKVDININR